MNVRIVLTVGAVLALAGCGQSAEVERPHDTSSTPAVAVESHGPDEAVSGRLAVQGGCATSSVELPEASSVPDPSPGRSDDTAGLPIMNTPPATIAQGAAKGFRAYLPELRGFDHHYTSMDGDFFYTFVSADPISSGTAPASFYGAGGIELIEQKDGSKQFLDELADHQGWSPPVAIGSHAGYLRQAEEVLPGVRPYEVMWTEGTTFFSLISGSAVASDAVNQARATVCS
jgi:hypothetical protein